MSTDPSKPSGPWIPPTPEELASLLPGYEIRTMLGRGGMGAVYMGKQISLERPVAIKILSGALEDSDLGFKERFKNEARAMAKLSHPGIVAVHDFGETDDGLLYIVMEYVEGTDVSRMIAAEGRLHTEYAMAITAHVCDALAYAHERGIIHRDIKPANIMVGYDGVVKVADFGLAKVHDDGRTLGLTMSGVAMGTMHYIAPEALDVGVTVDQRADLYAVGVMLYQMLTGRLPQGMFELPSMLIPGLDPRYDGIIARAMRENPDDRYPGARDLRADLDAILTQPVPRIEDAPTRAVASLPTMARPQRPGAGSRRQIAEGGPAKRPVPAKERSRAGVPWVVAAALILAGGGAFWVKRQTDDSSSGRPAPPVAIATSTATSPVPGSPSGVSKETPPPGSATPSAPQPVAPATTPASPAGSASMVSTQTPAVPAAPAPTPAKPPVLRKPWPTGPNYRSEGRFRAWSSNPGDSFLNLERLAGIDDAVQVYVNSTGWLVLRENGDLVSGIAAVKDHSDIKRICRGNEDEFALVTRDGKPIPFPLRTDAANRIPDNLGPVRDLYVSSFRQVAILEDGSLVAWGTAHDGIDSRGNGEWKDKPVLPPGSKAVAMSNAVGAMGVRTDDGKILRWGDNGGFGRAQGKFDADPETPFAMNHMALYGIPRTDGPILIANWRGNDPAASFPSDLRGRDFIPANKGGRNILVLDRDGGIVLDPMCEDRSITAALDFVSLAERDLVSVHLPERNSPVARFFWFDKASSPPSGVTTLPSEPDVLLGLPDFRTRVANYQAARHTQLAALTVKYRNALVAAKEAATQSGVLADATAATSALANAAAFAEQIEKNRTATGVIPLPPLAALADPSPARLKDLREIFVKEVARIEDTLVTGLDQSLAAVQTTLVQATKLTEATAVEEFRSRMMAAFRIYRVAPASLATKEEPFVNSLGMKFVPVPVTGGPADGDTLLFSVWETRNQDYEAFRAASGRPWTQPDFSQESDHPVVNVTWDDATAFCAWLTEAERKSGAVPEGAAYRLPTDHEWSCSVGLGSLESPTASPKEKSAGNPSLYPWGSSLEPPKGFANYQGTELDPFEFTGPVGSFPPNESGLFDTAGNVEEWCQEYFDRAHGDTRRIIRGRSWAAFGGFRASAARGPYRATRAEDIASLIGFRVVLVIPSGATKAAMPPPVAAPPSVKAPPEIGSRADIPPLAATTKKDPYKNTLGMKFVPVPGTKILMCIHETRMRDFEAFASENPTTAEGWKNLTARGVPVTPTEDHPVLDMSWQDGQDFCAWLGKKEQLTYRLPTDREWSYAVGIGEQESQAPDTSTAVLNGAIQEVYPWGSEWPPPKKAGNYADSLWATVFPGMPFIADYVDDHAAAAPVMSYDANALGIFDLGGNAEEWMQDNYDQSHGWRTVRGAAWRSHKAEVLLSSRRHFGGLERSIDFGFRVVIELPGSE